MPIVVCIFFNVKMILTYQQKLPKEQICLSANFLI